MYAIFFLLPWLNTYHWIEDLQWIFAINSKQISIFLLVTFDFLLIDDDWVGFKINGGNDWILASLTASISLSGQYVRHEQHYSFPTSV